MNCANDWDYVTLTEPDDLDCVIEEFSIMQSMMCYVESEGGEIIVY